MTPKLAEAFWSVCLPPGASAERTRTGGLATIARAGVLDEVQASEYPSPSTRTWRNWQTHQIQVLAPARVWGFNSPRSHEDL